MQIRTIHPGLLHNPMRRHIWKDWHENGHLWNSPPRGELAILVKGFNHDHDYHDDHWGFINPIENGHLWNSPSRGVRTSMYSETTPTSLQGVFDIYAKSKRTLLILIIINLPSLFSYQHIWTLNTRFWPKTAWQCLWMRSCTTRWFSAAFSKILIWQSVLPSRKP